MNEVDIARFLQDVQAENEVLRERLREGATANEAAWRKNYAKLQAECDRWREEAVTLRRAIDDWYRATDVELLAETRKLIEIAEGLHETGGGNGASDIVGATR
jgi:hypothetical protein